MPAESEEFERAWAQIVADLTADDRTDLAQMEQTDHRVDGSAEPADLPDPDADLRIDPAKRHPTAPEPPEHGGPSQDTPGEDRASQSREGDEVDPRSSDQDPAAFLATWADEGHFTPPPPPELPAGSPATRLGWAGTLGGVATMVLLTLTGWDVPRMIFWAAGFATLAGFVTLVWNLPDSRDDGWDDGAQV